MWTRERWLFLLAVQVLTLSKFYSMKQGYLHDFTPYFNLHMRMIFAAFQDQKAL